ncbi:hypothetical protein AB0L28_34205 [Streptomyces sp. NPDC052503]|uniref:hypothetical protein n=1 Tax=Streptomyces sp. NPDC052503 TaxID=3156683 RepID=UPI001370A7FB|nr:hypothetical protein [Streptomyces sp. SID7834]MYT60745.1 hypothetical protein [Streptomyces sp. SID7834]
MILGEWREAEENLDAKRLADFVCTLPSPPRPPTWEKSVQKFFQGEVWDKLRAVSDCDPHLRVVDDVQGIAAAYTHNRFDSRYSEFVLPEGYGSRLIGYLAVEARHRLHDGHLADQALEDSLYAVLNAEGQADRGVFVWAKVHQRNKASMRMLTRGGFVHRVSIPDDGPLQHWVLKLER